MTKKRANPSSDVQNRQRSKPEDSPANALRQDSRKPKPDFVENYVLPASYNSTRLTFLARDPYWIHAYWEIAPAALEATRQQIGGEYDRAVLVLRVYDVTCVDFNGSNANSWFDIDVGFHTQNWYINLWQDNVSFCGEIGLRLPDGRFLALTRSNFINTPRVASSGRTDMIWMAVNDRDQTRPYVMTQPRSTARRKPYDPFKGKTSRAATSRRRKFFLSEQDIREYYARLFPLLRVVRGGKDRARRGRAGWLGEDVMEGILPDEMYVPGRSRSTFLRRILLGSSAEMVLREGGSERALPTQGGASEREEKKRKFFFEIGTELIVYGRTEPDAEVLLGTNKVRLREDGTFTLRFALPDGKIPLDFVAQSADKQERRFISTSVERARTIYRP